MPPRVSLTAGGERGSQSLQQSPSHRNRPRASRDSGGRSLGPERRVKRELPGTRTQAAEFRSFWAAKGETRGKTSLGNTARAQGSLERKNGAGGEMGFAMPHPPFKSHSGMRLNQGQGTASRPDTHGSCGTHNHLCRAQIHPQPQITNPGSPGTPVFPAYVTLSTSEITGCFVCTVTALR